MKRKFALIFHEETRTGHVTRYLTSDSWWDGYVLLFEGRDADARVVIVSAQTCDSSLGKAVRLATKLHDEFVDVPKKGFGGS